MTGRLAPAEKLEERTPGRPFRMSPRVAAGAWRKAASSSTSTAIVEARALIPYGAAVTMISSTVAIAESDCGAASAWAAPARARVLAAASHTTREGGRPIAIHGTPLAKDELLCNNITVRQAVRLRRRPSRSSQGTMSSACQHARAGHEHLSGAALASALDTAAARCSARGER